MANSAPGARDAVSTLEEPIVPVAQELPGWARSWRHTRAGGLLREARPKQWVKNVLVVAAPAAAGVIGHRAGTVALAVLAFCLASSATYLLNDVADVEADRRHPRKRERPIAAGIVSVRAGFVTGVALLVAALAVAYAVRPAFLGVVVLYLAITSSYSVWLKHVPVLDLGVVAAGFLIRAVAGGVAVDVPISRWFLIVTAFASLFIVVGRRQGEQAIEGLELGATRSTLPSYSRSYLQSTSTMAAGVTITAYCLWAFEQSEKTSFPWYELTIVPFVLAMLRYGLLADSGKAAAPEDVFLSDRSIQVLSVVWAVSFALAVYVGK